MVGWDVYCRKYCGHFELACTHSRQRPIDLSGFLNCNLLRSWIFQKQVSDQIFAQTKRTLFSAHFNWSGKQFWSAIVRRGNDWLTRSWSQCCCCCWWCAQSFQVLFRLTTTTTNSRYYLLLPPSGHRRRTLTVGGSITVWLVSSFACLNSTATILPLDNNLNNNSWDFPLSQNSKNRPF